MKNRYILLQSLVLAGFGLCLMGSRHAVAMHALPPAPQTNASLTVQIELSESSLKAAKNFIDDVASRGIGFLGNASLSEIQRQSAFKTLLEDSFDMNTISRFALGRYWRSASKEQRTEYLQLFNDMIVGVYSDRFKEYDGQSLTVIDARIDGKSDAIVHSTIKSNDGNPDINVDWRVRKKNDNSYKIVDVIVEGVSMALTQRSDFSSVIQRGGGDIAVLLDHLRK